MNDNGKADKRQPVDVGAKYFQSARVGLVMIGFLSATISVVESDTDQSVAWFLGSFAVLSYLGAIILTLVQMNVIRWRTVRDDAPALHCAKCDGVIDPAEFPERCSECGADLRASGSIASGDIVMRERRYAYQWLIVGMCLALLAKYAYDIL